jgi:hypothetical protein
MRRTDVFLSVLFPILIAVGIALATTATLAAEFLLARLALYLAAAIPIALAFLAYQEADFKVRSNATLIIIVVLTLGTLALGIYWIWLKEETYCYITADLGPPGFQGPYVLRATSNGPYFALNVRVTIAGKAYEIGDVEPGLLRSLANVPPLPAGTHEIRIFARSGNFLEILKINSNGTQGWDVYRVTLDANGQPVLTRMKWP